jgi:DNA processing protein
VQDTDPSPPTHPRQAAALAGWIRLEQIPGLGCLGGARLLQHFGSPDAVFEAGHGTLAALGGQVLADALCAPLSDACARLIDLTLEWLARPGRCVLTLDDPAYPPLLRHIADPPLLLYVIGRPALLSRRALAIVGSRNASNQGKANAHAFARALSGAGLTIVSGLALGIDAAAHEGALGADGSTVAAIGTGPDIVYPSRNHKLAHRIAAEGCIISEYSLGTPPQAANFPRRNRLISGLAAGVLVVEAAEQSGSLITAHLAADQGREVFAIPGSIHSPLSKGCHKLLREGARLVESAADVLSELRLDAAAPARAAPAPVQDAVHARLLDALGHDPIGADTLAALTASDAGQLSAALLSLELAGLVERLPGGLFQRVNQAPGGTGLVSERA